jgi:trehalose 6-phosphate synthase
MLPMRAELIKGVVAADLAGFHTLEYSGKSFFKNLIILLTFNLDHFFSSCTQILKAESDEKQRKMLLSGHQCKFGVFPIGIDVAKIESTLKLESVQNRIKELEEKFKGKKVLLGIDRLDYIKGMPHRLLAFESFLKRFPTWRDKVALVQIAVPSRTSVPKYQKLCTQVNELVGKINGNFGSISSFPIHYLFQSVPLEELCALYAIADVCIVSSVRDGMNLVSHEYVVCQQKRNGVLILSEFAGAAKTLPKSSKINPWDIEHFADEIHKALKLDIEERRRKQKALYQYVSTNTASFWGKSFVNSLMKNIDREEEESRMSDFHSEQKEEETQ